MLQKQFSEVVQLEDVFEVNSYILNGWELLDTGHNQNDPESTQGSVVFVLGLPVTGVLRSVKRSVTKDIASKHNKKHHGHSEKTLKAVNHGYLHN